MIFAAIGSIDGHDAALERTLKAIEETGILTIIHTGNAVVGQQGGNAIMDLLAQFNVTCVQGNLDRLAVRYSRKQATLARQLDADLLEKLRWSHENLSSQNLEYIRDWRKTRTLDLEGLKVLVCHGSPGNPREILTADTPHTKLQRQREQSHADIIVSGGAESSFSVTVDGTLFVSPGPLVNEDGSTQFALINSDDTPWTATMETVAAP